MTENIEPNHSLEDVPLDQLKSTFTVSETAEPAQAIESSLPLGERLASKTPMVRKSAYAELTTLFEADGAPFEAHAPMLKKILADNARLCHEGALSATLAFALHAPAELVAEIVPGQG